MLFLEVKERVETQDQVRVKSELHHFVSVSLTDVSVRYKLHVMLST